MIYQTYIFYKKRGEDIELTHREFVPLFIKHMGRVMTREHLLQNSMGIYDYFGDVRTVDVTIHSFT